MKDNSFGIASFVYLSLVVSIADFRSAYDTAEHRLHQNLQSWR